ncbi:MAG: hypothetical protein JO069_16930 [Verrucomicrobia bacterium]|nr:hypothetical protein [Verrucomicrobiota bacterium]
MYEIYKAHKPGHAASPCRLRRKSAAFFGFYRDYLADLAAFKEELAALAPFTHGPDAKDNDSPSPLQRRSASA